MGFLEPWRPFKSHFLGEVIFLELFSRVPVGAVDVAFGKSPLIEVVSRSHGLVPEVLQLIHDNFILEFFVLSPDFIQLIF